MKKDSVYRLGNLEVGRGEKERGYLTVADWGDGTEIRIPLLVIRGKEDGPTVVISGGVHGDEYDGPRAIQNLWRTLQPEQIRGIWIGVPVVNPPAFSSGRRTSPIDGANMNRIFPGKADGFLSDRIAHCFFHNVVKTADFYLDLHAAGNAFTILPMVVYLETDDTGFRDKEVALAKAAGIEHLWKGTGVWPSAHVAAVRHGIPAILAEIGQEGRCSPERLAIGERTILNVCKHAGMLQGQMHLPSQWTIVRGTFQQSANGGCFYPMAQVGDVVKAGETVGLIMDYYGDTLETITSPYDGIICSTRTFPSIRPGEWTAFVGRIIDRIPAA
ncbi:MAG: succinylglutamate desuccinylase/aspartoacylase family protein [Anaerolineales bacterium]|nr:succinylglutamate desuccinylase/aspartoacylase family protein [Anaerolineales bacterium]